VWRKDTTPEPGTVPVVNGEDAFSKCFGCRHRGDDTPAHKVIGSYKLNLKPENVRIVNADDVFSK